MVMRRTHIDEIDYLRFIVVQRKDYLLRGLHSIVVQKSR